MTGLLEAAGFVCSRLLDVLADTSWLPISHGPHLTGRFVYLREVLVMLQNGEGSVEAADVHGHQDEFGANGARPMAGADAYLRNAFEDAPIGIALIGIEPGSNGRFLHVNRALCELTGYSLGELRQTDIYALLHPSDLSADRAAMTRLTQGDVDDFQLEQRLLHAERHAIWVTLNASLVRDAAGNPLYCIRQLQDIEERKRYEGELGYLVEHDPLTGLLN